MAQAVSKALKESLLARHPKPHLILTILCAAIWLTAARMHYCIHDVDGHASMTSEYSHIQVRFFYPLSPNVHSSLQLFSLLSSIQVPHLYLVSSSTSRLFACYCFIRRL